LPWGREPVSARSRPTTVDLPWSTCPTTTICIWGRDASFGAPAAEEEAKDFEGAVIVLMSHVPVATQLFQPVLAVLQPA